MIVSIGRAIALHAEKEPERPAVTHEGRSLTRRELDRRTNRLARAYAERGVGPDRFVTIGLPNGLEFYEAAVAAWKLGAIPQPISSRLPRPEREAIVELADPALVVGVDQTSVGGRSSVPAGFEPPSALPDTPLPDRTATWWKAPTSGGSTGRPKLIVAGGPGSVDLGAVPPFNIQPDGVMVVPGPLYHNAPFTSSMLGLFRGNHLVVLTRFDPRLTLALIERHRADFVLLVPTMMHRIWRLPPEERLRYDLGSLRTVWHMAAPCPPWLKEAWIEWLGPERLLELYAGTELQAMTTITGTEWLSHRGSVGRAAVGEMCVQGPDGERRSPGEIGEVFMRRPPDTPPTYRYIGAEPRTRGDWESLGDMGYLDGEGYLYLTDRQTDMILVGGANVYPAEIEAALEQHPRVRSSAVIGLPDDDLGQRIHALVQLDGEVDDADLLEHLAARLARYKVPRSVERVSEPLRDEAGKVRRSALREARLGR